MPLGGADWPNSVGLDSPTARTDKESMEHNFKVRMGDPSTFRGFSR